MTLESAIRRVIHVRLHHTTEQDGCCAVAADEIMKLIGQYDEDLENAACAARDLLDTLVQSFGGPNGHVTPGQFESMREIASRLNVVCP